MSRELSPSDKEALRALRALLDEKIKEKARVVLQMKDLAAHTRIGPNDPRFLLWSSLRERRIVINAEKEGIKDRMRSLFGGIAYEEKGDAQSVARAGDLSHLRNPVWRSRVSKKATSVRQEDEEDE